MSAFKHNKMDVEEILRQQMNGRAFSMSSMADLR